jgi:hypothetical protein
VTAIPLEAFPLERSVENYPSINDKRRHFRVYSSFAPSTISSLETEEEQTTLSFIAIPSGRAKLERQFKEAQ